MDSKPKKLIKFGALGGLVAVGSIVVTWILTDLLGLYYFYSYLCVLTTTTIINFYLNLKLVFKVSGNYYKRFAYYLASIGLFYLGDLALMRLITEFAGWHYAASILIAKVMVFFSKFLWYDQFLFSENSINNLNL